MMLEYRMTQMHWLHIPIVSHISDQQWWKWKQTYKLCCDQYLSCHQTKQNKNLKCVISPVCCNLWPPTDPKNDIILFCAHKNTKLCLIVLMFANFTGFIFWSHLLLTSAHKGSVSLQVSWPVVYWLHYLSCLLLLWSWVKCKSSNSLTCLLFL